MMKHILPVTFAAVLASCAEPAFAQIVVGAESGPIPVEVTLANGTLNSGNALGLFAIPIARIPGGSGIITSLLWKSVGGDATAKQARIWSAKPVNTTCTNGSAFASSDVDDAFLIGPGIFNFTPAAPTVTTGDSATYFSLTGLTWDYRNMDGLATNITPSNAVTPSQNVYVCVIAGASDTLDVSAKVRLTLSGPQN